MALVAFAIARLRMTVRLMGREDNLSFLVIMPRLINHQEFVKFLLNDEMVEFSDFGSLKNC